MYNVAIIVIDSLREDHAQGLEALRQLGFVQYHGVAPAPWTLPSHISMITGLMPSQHGVHEAPEIETTEQYGRLARLKMHKYNRGIIGELEKLGYHTAIITANPYLTPYFGFQTKEHHIVHATPLLSPTTPLIGYLETLKNEKGVVGATLHLLRKRKLRELAIGLGRFIQARTTSIRVLLKDPKNKGAQKIHQLVKLPRQTPYLLLINIVEAHEPYSRIWPLKLINSIYLKTILENRCPPYAYRFLKNYPQFAEIAVKAAVKIAQELTDDKTLVIVTSDHGQGLCDPGFLHGYWLYDGLVRVPLWIKFPRGIQPLEQKIKISITEIPTLIRYIVTGEKISLRSNGACSESFGPFILFSKKLNDLFTYRKYCI